MNSKSSSRRRSPRSRQTSRKPSSIQLNSSMTSRRKEKRAARRTAKAEYLARLPKDKWKRIAARLKPNHLVDYWFSRDGAIMGLKLIGLSIVFGFFLLIGIFAYFRKDLASINSISGNNIGGSISFYDRTGKVLLWQDYSSVKRIPVQSTQISNYMKQATVAIEDKRFYTEGGFDIGAILRSGFHDIIHHGQGLQGASTITEQVVKLNKGWPDPLTIPEKIEEIILSSELSRNYTKSQILTSYLNIAPYGSIDFGVQAASQDYFHEAASQITLAQAAFLASIPQAPTAYSPYSSPTFNAAVSVNYFDSIGITARSHYVLELMAQQHMITQAQANQALKVNVLGEVQPLKSKYQNIKAPYFVMAAEQQIRNTYGAQLVSHGGLNVITTLNLGLQQLAEQKVQSNIPNITRYGADEEALVAESVKTGQVVALIGGTNFYNTNHGQINYAQTNVSPGSSIKPFVYSTLINNSTNVGAGSVLYDVQEPLPGYPCTNKNIPSKGGNCLMDYDYHFPGPETIRYALAGSRNVPAVKAGLQAGISNVQATASKMMGYPDAYRCYQPGANVMTATIKQQTACYGSAAIGAGYLDLSQEVNGDATLARLGQVVPQTYILSITDASGKTLYKWQQPKPSQAIKTDAAYIIDNILSDPRASYLPGYCSTFTCGQLSSGFNYKWQRYNGWDIAVKTGTENNNLDGLMTAWDTQYAVVTWVSYHTYDRPLQGNAMELMTEPLARGWMQGALDMLHTKPVNWTQPADIKTIAGFVQRTHVGVGSQEPGPIKEIFPSWYTGANAGNVTRVIDKVSGGIATTCTPADAKETIYGASSNSFSVDKFWPLNKNANNNAAATTTYDSIHQCSDQPPQVTLTAPQQCLNTANNSQGCAITITATQGTHPLGGGNFGGTVSLSINGAVVKTFSVSNSPATVTYYYAPTASGTVNVTATVTDSVLYQASQSAQMQDQYTAPATAPSSTNSTNTQTNSSPKNSGPQ